MATYKVIQDIEAEDKILGPLTLRQFIYTLVAGFCFYLSFIVLTKHVAFLLVIFLPPALFFGFLALPFGRDQPTEVWAIAKLRFLIKPRRRIWDQSGIKELVTITAPKREERVYTDGLNQVEVKSRLRALADTIDSRGWAVKNVNLNLYSQPVLVGGGSDRLIDINNIPQAVPDIDVQASDDMLDVQSNPVAQQFTQMIGASTQAHRQQLIDELNSVRAAESQKQGDGQNNYWFANQGGATPTASDEAILDEAKKRDMQQTSYNTHLRTIQPLDGQPPELPKATAHKGESASGKAPEPAILELANRDDLNVSTIARRAKKATGDDSADDEVIIPLH